MDKNFEIYCIEIKSGCFFLVVLNENVPCLKSEELLDDMQCIYNKIDQYVVAEKHFLDKDITMDTLVRQCNVKKELLNKALRLKENITFHRYINKQRIIYASSLLLDPTNKLIEVVALEACFNSARTFVRNFKAVYNMTPSEYRRNNRNKRKSLD